MQLPAVTRILLSILLAPLVASLWAVAAIGADRKARGITAVAVALTWTIALAFIFPTPPPAKPAAIAQPTPTPTPSYTPPTLDPATPTPTPSPTPSRTATRSPSPTPAAGLSGLQVAAERNADTYDRDLFRYWIDADGDCEDTRAEVLKDESLVDVTLSETCRVLTGRWISLYDGEVVTEAGRLDIDHFVPLAEAWRSGAWAWSDEKRRLFANDLSSPKTLIAVTLGTNRSKGDRDPAEWMPPADSAWCRYARDWIAVKVRWRLTADREEASALRSALTTC